MAGGMRQAFNEMRGMKVTEAGKKMKEKATISNARNFIQRSLDNYHAKYIVTDSVTPVYHVCFGGMIFSYLVALPEERRHLAKHAAEAHAH